MNEYCITDYRAWGNDLSKNQYVANIYYWHAESPMKAIENCLGIKTARTTLPLASVDIVVSNMVTGKHYKYIEQNKGERSN